jgi:nucleoside phosphorylase
MAPDAGILVVAATTRELATSHDHSWRTLICGVGPVEAAASTAAAIAEERPAAVVHVGIAGVRRAANIAPSSLVIGTESRYCDLEIPEEWAPRIVVTSPQLIEAAHDAIPTATRIAIGTSARVGGTTGCDVEAMEGFAVLRAAQRAGIPAIEVRAISNEIEEEDRTRWQFTAAFAAITAATPLLVSAIHRSVSSRTPAA